MTRAEILEIQKEYAVTNEVVQKLCAEVLALDSIVDRMASDIAGLVRENEDLAQAAAVLDGAVDALEGVEITEEPTELNTQIYGVPV